MNFVQQLLLYRRLRDQPASIGQLGHGILSVFCHRQDRKANIPKLRYLLIIRICKITTCDLSAALHQMTANRAFAHQIGIVKRPAKLIHHRRQKERRISCAASNHDICASAQCLHDTFGTNIGIGRDDRVAQIFDRSVVFQQRLILITHNVCKHIIARDSGDF